MHFDIFGICVDARLVAAIDRMPLASFILVVNGHRVRPAFLGISEEVAVFYQCFANRQRRHHLGGKRPGLMGLRGARPQVNTSGLDEGLQVDLCKVANKCTLGCEARDTNRCERSVARPCPRHCSPSIHARRQPCPAVQLSTPQSQIRYAPNESCL